jgi:hypothetical protein
MSGAILCFKLSQGGSPKGHKNNAIVKFLGVGGNTIFIGET